MRAESLESPRTHTPERLHAVEEPVLSFIVPTLDRPTLSQAIESIRRQADPCWRLVIVGDGVEPIVPDDPRISVIRHDKVGKAGSLRNVGIAEADTPWVGFLDDDDILTPDYLTRFAEESPGADVVVFRMDTPTLGLVPHRPKVRWTDVGISFAVRRDIALEHPFIDQEPSYAHAEDYEFLRSLDSLGASIRFSPHLTYIVRPDAERIPYRQQAALRSYFATARMLKNNPRLDWLVGRVVRPSHNARMDRIMRGFSS